LWAKTQGLGLLLVRLVKLDCVFRRGDGFAVPLLKRVLGVALGRTDGSHDLGREVLNLIGPVLTELSGLVEGSLEGLGFSGLVRLLTQVLIQDALSVLLSVVDR
jgi:hypothetical protein